jgi:hypothetical protein
MFNSFKSGTFWFKLSSYLYSLKTNHEGNSWLMRKDQEIEMKRFSIFIIILAVITAVFIPTPKSIVSASTIPTFSIVSVVTDSTVTIKTYNFPKNLDFKVTMGKYGTRGVGGTVVKTTNSGEGGSLSLTYDIPSGLKGLDRIAIRLDSGIGFYAYNWFWNNTSTTTSTSTTVTGYTGIPTFSIVSVEADSKVTIKTNNFPKNLDFKVTMGKYGTKGIGGTVVTTTNSGSGGTTTLTYDIPAGLKGLDRIAIRLDSGIGFYAYNWFWNNTTSTSSTSSTTTTTVSGYTGIPTFSIVSVVEDSKVTIKTNNFPKDLDFKVTMGLYGTKGVGGTLVTTTNSGDGGVKSLTYDIPGGLKGLDRIAIRLDSGIGFYAYNWFWNNDAP